MPAARSTMSCGERNCISPTSTRAGVPVNVTICRDPPRLDSVAVSPPIATAASSSRAPAMATRPRAESVLSDCVTSSTRNRTAISSAEASTGSDGSTGVGWTGLDWTASGVAGSSLGERSKIAAADPSSAEATVPSGARSRSTRSFLVVTIASGEASVTTPSSVQATTDSSPQRPSSVNRSPPVSFSRAETRSAPKRMPWASSSSCTCPARSSR